MSPKFENLVKEVTEIKEVTLSAVTLIKGLKQKLDDAGTDADALAALSAELDNSANELAAAITENTPAA